MATEVGRLTCPLSPPRYHKTTRYLSGSLSHGLVRHRHIVHECHCSYCLRTIEECPVPVILYMHDTSVSHQPQLGLHTRDEVCLFCFFIKKSNCVIVASDQIYPCHQLTSNRVLITVGAHIPARAYSVWSKSCKLWSACSSLSLQILYT